MRNRFKLYTTGYRNEAPMRLLPTVRLSLENDESTSPERQMARMQQYAQLNDHTLIPIGPDDYDLGVSWAGILRLR
jgi:hypothetical protein